MAAVGRPFSDSLLDPEACRRHGVRVLEGAGSPVAPAELCRALIMAAQRHLPAYASQLRQGHCFGTAFENLLSHFAVA